MKKCPNCLKEIKEEAKFCGYCGKIIVIDQNKDYKAVESEPPQEEIMKECPYCGTENKEGAFRCKNEDCCEILPKPKVENDSYIPDSLIEKHKEIIAESEKKRKIYYWWGILFVILAFIPATYLIGVIGILIIFQKLLNAVKIEEHSIGFIDGFNNDMKK